MRILHTGDLHVTEGPRLGDQIAVLAAIVESARETGVALSVIGGDIAGTAVPHVATVQERAALAEFLQALGMLAPVVLVRGNHDDVEDVQLYARLRCEHPIIVSHVPDVVRFAGVGPIHAVQVFSLPWVTTGTLGEVMSARGIAVGPEMLRTEAMKRFHEFIEGWVASYPREPNTVRILAGHVAIGGARLAGGEVLLGHDVEVPAALFDRLDLDYRAFSHIHLAQRVGQRGYYAGSPSAHSFGEEGDMKGWNIVEVAPEKDVTMLRIPSPAAQMLTVNATWDTVAATWALDTDLSEIKGKEIRVRVHIPEDIMSIVDTSTLDVELRAFGARLVVVERHVEVRERLRSPAMAQAHTIEAQAQAALDALTPPVEAETRERVTEQVREVVAACGYTGSS
jgi:exonuclease SbcD